MMNKKEMLNKLDMLKNEDFYSVSIDEITDSSKAYWDGQRTCLITILGLKLKDNKLPWEK